MPLELPDSHDLTLLQQRLIDWFASTARDLPWRHTRDPYRILVAEMMLQQTQVDRVLPRYTAFLEVFPGLETLAKAPTATVIQMWAGLGYNRRAVNLQRAARVVLAEHGGIFPQDVTRLQQLPGIGPYTAGAIACFAFEQDVAFMDTNIRRVLRRILVGPDSTNQPSGDRLLLPLAQALIPPGQGWTWNQALMELGALICTAAAPACQRCPLRVHCHAYTAWRNADEQAFSGSAEIIDYTTTRQRTVRRVAEQRGEAFVGSNRYYRGRLIAILRELAPGTTLSLPQLGAQIRADYTDDHQSWLQSLLAGLARDGLVELVDDRVRLPTE